MPCLKACPQFESDSREREDANAGTRRHLALQALNSTGSIPEPLKAELDEESMEGVEWASEYIEQHKVGNCIWETKIAIAVTVQGETFTIEGTPDARDSGRNLFDLKSRHRDAEGQMAAYALGIMQDDFTTEIQVHVLYAIPMRAVSYTLTDDEAIHIIQDILTPVIDNAPARPCEYCVWCAKSATCEALTSRVEAVRAGREDWSLATYHASDIADPVEMAKALELARAIKQWAASVEYHANTMAKNHGGLPGFETQTKKGRRSISDVAAACQLAGINPDEFVKICSAPIGKVEEVFRKLHGHEYTSKAAANRDLQSKLAPVIEYGAPSISLVKIK